MRFTSKYKKAQTEVVTIMILTGIAVAMVSVSYMWGKPLVEKSQTKTDIDQAKDIMFSIQDAVREVSIYGGQKIINIDLKGTLKIDGAARDASGNYININRNNWVTYTVETRSIGTSTSEWVPIDDMSPIKYETYTGNDTLTLSINGTSCATVNIDCGANPPTALISCGAYGSANGQEDTHFDAKPEYKIGYIHCTSAPYFVTVMGPEEPVPGVIGLNKPGSIIMRAKGKGDGYSNSIRLAYRDLDDLNTGKGYLIQLVKGGNTLADSGQHKLFIKAERDKIFDDPLLRSQTGSPVTIIPIIMYIE